MEYAQGMYASGRGSILSRASSIEQPSLFSIFGRYSLETQFVIVVALARRYF